MRYKIGDVARLIGITPEAIRYYESRNIIKPTREEDTGYRYYDVWDIHMLIRARHYRQFGFSLEETATLLNEENLTGIVDTLNQQEQVLEDQITWNINLLRQIRQSQQYISDAEQSIGKYRLEQRPGIYRISMQDGYSLRHERSARSLAHEWIEKTPFVYSSALFSCDLRGGGGFSFGLGVNEEYAPLLGIQESEDVRYFPPCLCVYTCLPSRSHSVLSPHKLDGALDYLRQKGFELSGDIVTRIVLMRRPNEEYFNWHQVWLPISEKI